jgi:hypothetical protein
VPSVSLRIVHPGSSESLSVEALRVAVGEATHGDEADWMALLGTGYRFPTLEPGERVDLDDIAVVIEYVAQRVERAAAMAVEIHGGLVTAGMAAPTSRRDIVGGLAGFIIGARRWLDAARRTGGPAAVEVGTPTIDDPSLPKWR